MKEEDVITVEGLRKTYGTIKAVDGVTFQVCKAEIFGMVGPNGSGKTTTIECIEGLRRPDKGSLRVLGLDPQRDYLTLRERTGVQLQASNLPPRCEVIYFLILSHSADAFTEELAGRETPRFGLALRWQKQRLFVAWH
jgi:ABC-2 type transport system ATP-binding protein